MKRVILLRCHIIQYSSFRNKAWTPSSNNFKKISAPNIFHFPKFPFGFLKRWSSSYKENLAGVYPPITTPFDINGNIIYEQLKLNIKLWENIPFRGYAVLGSTGEFVSLTEDERINAVKFVKQNVSPDKLVIAGTGCESTKATIELTNKIAEAGANFALIVSPFFYKGRLTEDALLDHYIKVADFSKIPIILYSVPANTNIDLSPSLVVRLADHPNIIGLKDSGGDITKIGLIVHQTKNMNFQVLAGSAGFFYSALCVGCIGGILALANPLGASLCELHQLFLNGRHNESCELQHKLIGPNLAVTKKFGIPGVKSALDMLGYYGGPPRLPLKQLTPSENKLLREEFEASGFV